MKYILYKQYPKPDKKGIKGIFTVTGIGKTEATFCTGGTMQDVIVARLEKPEIVDANEQGITLKGYEPDGCDTKTGVPKFRYQEWWLKYECF